MPKPSLHMIIWSEVSEHYELQCRGQKEQWFSQGDELAFSQWLEKHSAFAFVGRAGRLSARKEERSGGRSYWYAYRKQDRHTRKGYLGISAQVTFARLEEQARAFACLLASPARVPEPAPSSSEQKVTLLSTKLIPPRLPTFLVERPRLLGDLDAIWTYPLTLISSAAGSGKTTLLADWASKQEKFVAWLSLDSLDNDPIRFWSLYIAGLRKYQPTFGEETLALLHAGIVPPLSTILVALLNEVVLLDQEVILILDGFHVISDQTIHEGISFVLDHLPANLHLVLISRTDPELPLSRLRMHGQLLEIRFGDLRFTQEEASVFLLQSMDLPLTEEDVTLLSRRTEGWIAGLQLAAISLRKQKDLSRWVSDFAGSYRYLLDYVQQDILAPLPVPLQDFLLQVSIVTRMDAAVCQAVTAGATREESQQWLEEVERANLFVVHLDEQRQWYRFHDLFREVLLTRLQARQPELVPVLHQRAATFYEATGELREAITHALAAADYSYAASLMEQAAPQFWLNGETRTIHSWVLTLPDSILCAHTHLVLDTALRLLSHSVNLSSNTLFASLVTQMESTFTRMDQILQKKQELLLSDAEEVLIKRRLHLLRVLIEARTLIKRGDYERLRLLIHEAKG
ncbi:MAG: LuxR family transcriptional regulator, partial [Chloroflexi bacterium]|nr:LuxR family transcriptional regulator [Chloroflexota bacterium]